MARAARDPTSAPFRDRYECAGVRVLVGNPSRLHTHRLPPLIGPELLAVTTDCGFARQGVNRAVAAHEASALAQGTNVVRRELGHPPAPVRAADPALQIDTPAPG